MTKTFSPYAFVVVTLGILNTVLGANVFAAEGDIVVENITTNLTLFAGAGGNVVVHEGPDSLVLIDGGLPERSKALLEAIEDRFDNKPIVTLINTHWHLEQTGSNDALGKAGVEIIAHENTRRWMTTSIEQHWDGQVFEPRASIALPTRTFYLQDSVIHGNETIQLLYTPRAHTDGDIIALFPKTNVIVAGGTAYSGFYPILDTATNGWIGELLDATRTMISHADDKTIIVPADGHLLRLSDLVEQEEMLAALLLRFQQMSKKGLGADDMLAEGIADEYIEKWGDPSEFIFTAWDGLWDHMRGLGAF